MPDDQLDSQQNNSLDAASQPEASPDILTGKETLDAPSAAESTAAQTTNDTQTETPKPKKASIISKIKALSGHFNIYIIIFVILLLLIAIGIYAFNALNSKSSNPGNTTTSGKLSTEALSQLQNTDVKIGDPKQVLGIESNTIFAGKVLVRDSLEVAGSLKLGGNLSLAGLTVAGTSSFDQVQANSIAISQNAAVAGQLTVQRNLNVAGGGSFGGALSAPQITVDTLLLNKDLQLSHHIDPTGATPGKSDGTALGSGGTSSVSGTDTAGTVTINTGGSPPAGCFITISFTQHFNGTPHISLTPANSSAANLNYYTNRTTNNFSVCSANAPSAGQNYIFDYIVLD